MRRSGRSTRMLEEAYTYVGGPKIVLCLDQSQRQNLIALAQDYGLIRRYGMGEVGLKADDFHTWKIFLARGQGREAKVFCDHTLLEDDTYLVPSEKDALRNAIALSERSIISEPPGGWFTFSAF